MNKGLHPELLALEQQFSRCPVTQIIDDELSAYGVELWIKRDDLLHPVLSGNKWRKLKYILNHALQLGADSIISMGGVYSNHLHALAFAGKALGIQTAAYIRGEAPDLFTPTLIDIQEWGMDLWFVSRSAYRQLRNYKQHDSLPSLKPGQYWLTEGGATELALLGIAESLAEIEMEFDALAVACGTGTTLAGLIAHAPENSRILGIASLKAGFLAADVQQLLSAQGIDQNNWQINLDYHFGGFAATTPALLEFIHRFEARHNIPLEPVYTGKLMYAVYDLIKQGHFSAGQRLVVIHTGGLQGNRADLNCMYSI